MSELEIYTSKDDIHISILKVCLQWAESRSKDPNTKVGAAIYDNDTGNIFLGYNGFPSNIPDYKKYWDCRDIKDPNNKYIRTVHAEANAIRKAGQLTNATLYCTLQPCNDCLKNFVAAYGIKQVYYIDRSANHDIELTNRLAQEFNIELIRISESYFNS